MLHIHNWHPFKLSSQKPNISDRSIVSFPTLSLSFPTHSLKAQISKSSLFCQSIITYRLVQKYFPPKSSKAFPNSAFFLSSKTKQVHETIIMSFSPILSFFFFSTLTFLFLSSHSSTILVDGTSEWKNPTVYIGDSIGKYSKTQNGNVIGIFMIIEIN